jgi:hypothetical protein
VDVILTLLGAFAFLLMAVVMVFVGLALGIAGWAIFGRRGAEDHWEGGLFLTPDTPPLRRVDKPGPTP